MTPLLKVGDWNGEVGFKLSRDLRGVEWVFDSVFKNYFSNRLNLRRN